MTRRTLVIGDIHGCVEELMGLLALAEIGPDDRVVAVGDIVDRGPDPASVVRYFRDEPNAMSVMGNHERKNARWRRAKLLPAKSQLICRAQMGDTAWSEACDWFETLPHFLELDEAIVLHGFALPSVPLEEQDERVLVGVQSGWKTVSQTLGRNWFESWNGDKPLVVGHLQYGSDHRPFVVEGRFYGLDTGCSTGGALSGLLLPSFEVLSVPARRNHWGAVKARWSGVLPVPRHKMTWEQAVGDPDWLAAGEKAVDQLLAAVRSRHADAMATATAAGDWDALPLEGRGRRYSDAIGRTPLAFLLHRMRKAGLTRDDVRAAFRLPQRAMDLRDRVGLS